MATAWEIMEAIEEAEFSPSDTPYTEEQREFAEFLTKADWEGGYADLIGHSGTSLFPSYLKAAASALQEALDALEAAVDGYAIAVGVEL